MGGDDLSSGSVDINVNGHWLSLCSQYWDNKTAQVACNMLGYDRYRAIKTDHPLEGITLVINTHSCTGNENRLSDCMFSAGYWTLNYCITNRKAGVVCEGSDPKLDFQPLSVAYDPFDEIFYVSHVNLVSNISQIIAYNRRGDMIRSLSNIPDGSIIKHLVLDTKRNMLYYTDSGNDMIGAISPDGTESMILVGNITEPGWLTLDKERMVIYWTDKENKRIMKINTDGKNHRQFYTGLEDPRGITFNQESQKIFFITGKSMIEYINVNDWNKYNVATYSDVDLYGLTSASKYLFFSDLKNKKIMRIEFNSTSNKLESTTDFPEVYDMNAIQVSLS